MCTKCISFVLQKSWPRFIESTIILTEISRIRKKTLKQDVSFWPAKVTGVNSMANSIFAVELRNLAALLAARHFEKRTVIKRRGKVKLSDGAAVLPHSVKHQKYIILPCDVNFIVPLDLRYKNKVHV